LKMKQKINTYETIEARYQLWAYLMLRYLIAIAT